MVIKEFLMEKNVYLPLKNWILGISYCHNSFNPCPLHSMFKFNNFAFILTKLDRQMDSPLTSHMTDRAHYFCLEPCPFHTACCHKVWLKFCHSIISVPNSGFSCLGGMLTTCSNGVNISQCYHKLSVLLR